jgi:hypothetical protein
MAIPVYLSIFGFQTPHTLVVNWMVDLSVTTSSFPYHTQYCPNLTVHTPSYLNSTAKAHAVSSTAVSRRFPQQKLPMQIYYSIRTVQPV